MSVRGAVISLAGGIVRLKATPRGSHWDKLNRDGSVKEIEVDAGHSERRLRERMVENFPALATADLSR